MARRVGIYTRISRDDEGDALGVARRQQDCERRTDLRSWQAVKVYEDNDVSAYKRNVVREEFELMLNDLRSGLVDGIVRVGAIDPTPGEPVIPAHEFLCRKQDA